jgi:hypothetical protein
LHAENYPKGVYFIHLNSDKGSEIQKLIIK